jgi:hypothetical protein
VDEKVFCVIVTDIGSYLGLMRWFFVKIPNNAKDKDVRPLVGFNDSEIASPS